MKHCTVCSRGLIPQRTWVAASQAEREAWKADGLARADGRGLCSACWFRNRRTAEVGRSTRTRDEVLEDWELLRSDGPITVAQAAERMGMTKGALEKALERARKAGDPRAMPSATSQGTGMRRGVTGWTSRMAA